MKQNEGRPGGLPVNEAPAGLRHSAGIPDALADQIGEYLSSLDEVVMTDTERAAALVAHWESLRHSARRFKMKPVTECIALFNVSLENRVAIYASGPLSAREYKSLIRMVELDLETAQEIEAREDAPKPPKPGEDPTP